VLIQRSKVTGWWRSLKLAHVLLPSGLASYFSLVVSLAGAYNVTTAHVHVLFMKERTTIRLITCQVRGLACAVNLLTERGVCGDLTHTPRETFACAMSSAVSESEMMANSRSVAMCMMRLLRRATSLSRFSDMKALHMGAT
jgi:hypothetical protein